MLRKGKQFLLHQRHPLCYYSYKPGYKSRMRKGQGSVYDEWNISVVICDTFIFHNGQPSHGIVCMQKLIPSNVRSLNTYNENNHTRDEFAYFLLCIFFKKAHQQTSVIVLTIAFLIISFLFYVKMHRIMILTFPSFRYLHCYIHTMSKYRLMQWNKDEHRATKYCEIFQLTSHEFIYQCCVVVVWGVVCNTGNQLLDKYTISRVQT